MYKHLRIFATTLMFIFVALVTSTAQENSNIVGSQHRYEENFDGGNSDFMLGGQLDLDTTNSKWVVYVSDGKMKMENRSHPNSLHYDDISWIKFNQSNHLSSTDGARISVSVLAKNKGRGSAGIIVGSGEKGYYWMFGVDNQGGFHLVNKSGRKTKRIHSDKNPNVLIDGVNRISFQRSENRIAFQVNGVELIQVPVDSRKNFYQGIGLAAFGIGTFSFDDVEIIKLK